MLAESGLLMQAKPFAAGVRIEHPRELIDRSQFGAFAGHPRLGAAEYHLADQSGGRGVYTFCMCPGGSVVACASEQGGVVTNGMSCYARNGENSNAAVVVQVDARDYGAADPLAGLRFREALEREAFRRGAAALLLLRRRLEIISQGAHPAALEPFARPMRLACVPRMLRHAFPVLWLLAYGTASLLLAAG